MTTPFVATCAAAGLGLVAAVAAFAEAGTTPTSGYAKVNGLSLYYEIHGTGEPLILLHGGLGAIDMFGDILPVLSKARRVIGVDLHPPGRTAGLDPPMSFEAMADDIPAL